MTHKLDMKVDSDRLILPDYPFPRQGTRTIKADAIVEAIDWLPPAIRTRDGEFLFVAQTHRDSLQRFCAARGIVFGVQYEAWADLLAPFLDTELSAEEQEDIMRNLAAVGIPEQDVTALRKLVRRRMTWLTLDSWEWVHYGLADLLDAMKPPVILRPAKWDTFYRMAMAVAVRGCDGASESR